MPDLSPLNPAEREVLGLLARGHTAKSIASATGRSVGSVNERLREARRKTGVSSSRELARLAFPQETRDQQIGVAAAPDRDEPDRDAAAMGGWRSKGLIAMGIVTLSAAAAAALLLPAAQDGDPRAASEAMRAAFAQQPRDSEWSPRAEAALRARYAAIPEIASSLAVVCTTSQCLVTADFAPDDGVMQRLQGNAVAGRLAALAMTNHSGSFELGKKAPGVMRYTGWWLRES